MSDSIGERRRRGWELLHSALPSKAIKPLATAVYGVAGLSDVNEGYLIQRLFASGMSWDWRIVKQEYLGAEDRAVKDKDYTQRYYLAAVHGELTIEGRTFHGSGASDNRRPDAAYKGAATVAFKSACKFAGLTAELYLDGRAIDHIYQGRVTKDPDMAPASVDALVAQIEDTFGPPEQAQEDTQGTAPRNPGDAESKTNGPVEPASVQPEPNVPAEVALPADMLTLDWEPLFTLGDSLPKEKQPEQVIVDLVVKHGYATIRRRLIAAHALQCGKSPCQHVAELAGLAVTK